MLAKWVLDMGRIGGWDLLAKVLKTWGVVTSILIVVAAAVVEVRKSTDTSSGQRQGSQGGIVKDHIGHCVLCGLYWPEEQEACHRCGYPQEKR
jgi:hypothetical protein